jgi:hypothetical protein
MRRSPRAPPWRSRRWSRGDLPATRTGLVPGLVATRVRSPARQASTASLIWSASGLVSHDTDSEVKRIFRAGRCAPLVPSGAGGRSGGRRAGSVTYESHPPRARPAGPSAAEGHIGCAAPRRRRRRRGPRPPSPRTPRIRQQLAGAAPSSRASATTRGRRRDAAAPPGAAARGAARRARPRRGRGLEHVGRHRHQRAAQNTTVASANRASSRPRPPAAVRAGRPAAPTAARRSRRRPSVPDVGHARHVPRHQ